MAEPRPRMLLAPDSADRLVVPVAAEQASPPGLVQIGFSSGGSDLRGAGAVDPRSWRPFAAGRSGRRDRVGTAPGPGAFRARDGRIDDLDGSSRRSRPVAARDDRAFATRLA